MILSTTYLRKSRRGVFYDFPKNFQAKLNKNEWNIYKYSGKHWWSWTNKLILQNCIDVIELRYIFLLFTKLISKNSTLTFITPLLLHSREYVYRGSKVKLKFNSQTFLQKVNIFSHVKVMATQRGQISHIHGNFL